MRTLITEKLELHRQKHEQKGRLLVSCPDQPGIVSAVSSFYLSTERTSLNRANTQPIMKAAGSF